MQKIKYQNIIIAIAVLTFVFSAGLTGTQVKAAEYGFEEQSQEVERAELILESFEEGSYETWRKLVNPNSKIARKIEKKDFYEFIKARNLARKGEYQEAWDLCEDLRTRLGLSGKEIEKIVESLGVSDI